MSSNNLEQVNRLQSIVLEIYIAFKAFYHFGTIGISVRVSLLEAF